jgi:hypothetical protein
MRGKLRNREATLFRADGVVSSARCLILQPERGPNRPDVPG